MHHPTTIFFLWLAIILQTGCDKPLLSEGDYTTIYMDSLQEGSSHSDLFDYSYVVLHGLPEGEAIFYFAKILKFEGGFICWEERNQSIYFYNNDGLYLHHIDAVGAGPAEYGDIGDICYDPDTETLIVLDMNHSMISYDLEGNGLSEVLLPQKASDVALDHNGKFTFVSYLRDSCTIWKSGANLNMECVDMGDNIIGPYYSQSDFKIAPGIEGPDLLVTFPLSEYIYAIQDNRLQKKYRIDYGERKVWSSDFVSDMSVIQQVDYFNAHNDFIQYSGTIFTTQSWLFFYQINKYYVRQKKAIEGYHPSEYIFYHPGKGTFSINTLVDDRNFKFDWRIRGSFGETIIHHMYFSDRERVVEEHIDLKTSTGESVLDLMDTTAEILVLMTMK